MYRSIKKLRDISGYSADYILFGIDDHVIDKTQRLLESYTNEEIEKAIDIIKDITIFIKK